MIFIKTYLFDFDGTLVDSMPTYASAMLRILDENNVSYNDDIIKTITPLGVDGTAEYYISLGIKLSKEEIISFMKKYLREEYELRVPAKKNVIFVLNELKKQGASLNILTASPHTCLDPCLKRLGIFELFDNVWSCNDFETTKANPEIYKMVAKSLGEEVQNILFLDDNYIADKTAKSAGLMVCGVYDDSSKDFVDEIKLVSDFYIYDFKELLDL